MELQEKQKPMAVMAKKKYSLMERILIVAFKLVNMVVAWHKLPWYVGIFNLLAFRIELEADNLHDTYPPQSEGAQMGTKDSFPMTDSRYITTRHSDGYFNDLDKPMMGCAGRRFGRNVKRSITQRPPDREVLSPNPRVVADTLLKRTTFQPATIVNLLAAAWIQFQVHDWAVHDPVGQSSCEASDHLYLSSVLTTWFVIGPQRQD